MLVGISEAICLLSTYLINIFDLFKYFFSNLINFCKESINDFTNNDEIETQINKYKINFPKKKISNERFYE
jgi:hypothetical protein